MAKTLKMVFQLQDAKTSTFSIPDPKDGLTKTEVQETADTMVTKDFVRASGLAAQNLKDAYIQSSERIELA